MIVFKIAKVEKLNNPLSENILLHCHEKYKGEKLTESLFAYQSLSLLYKEKTGKVLPEISFNESGKPICNEISVTLSHDSGVIAVGFSTEKTYIGVDVEEIKDKKPNVTKLLGLSESCSNEDFYLEWTKKEALKKSLNLSLFKGKTKEFIGESKIVTVDGKKYALSVYSKESYESNF